MKTPPGTQEGRYHGMYRLKLRCTFISISHNSHNAMMPCYSKCFLFCLLWSFRLSFGINKIAPRLKHGSITRRSILALLSANPVLTSAVNYDFFSKNYDDLDGDVTIK